MISLHAFIACAQLTCKQVQTRYHSTGCCDPGSEHNYVNICANGSDQIDYTFTFDQDEVNQLTGGRGKISYRHIIEGDGSNVYWENTFFSYDVHAKDGCTLSHIPGFGTTTWTQSADSAHENKPLLTHPELYTANTEIRYARDPRVPTGETVSTTVMSDCSFARDLEARNLCSTPHDDLKTVCEHVVEEMNKRSDVVRCKEQVVASGTGTRKTVNEPGIVYRTLPQLTDPTQALLIRHLTGRENTLVKVVS